MTPINELIEIIKAKRKDTEISNTLLRFVQFEAEKLLKTEKKQKDEFAIGFADWLQDKWVDDERWSKNTGNKELLEIYKNTL